jgi:ERCC4-related helicase
MDFDKLIGTSKAKSTKSKTKKSAEIHAVPENIQEKIDSLIQAKKDKKAAEGRIKVSEVDIIEYGHNLKDKKAFSGKYQKSYKLGNDDSHVNFVTANKYLINSDDISLIKEILEDRFSEFVEEETEVKLKSEVFKDPELQKKFVKMVGKAFPEFFETEISYHVTENFDELKYSLSKPDKEDLETFVKQAKPSLR